MRKEKVLISPLNWGLGHATRMVPIIQNYIDNGWEVQLAANGKAHSFLKNRFPKLQLHHFGFPEIVYGQSFFFILKMMFQLPGIFAGIKKEHIQLRKLHKKEQFDLIISDNRYGLYIKSVRSVFACHQTELQLPKRVQFLKGFINKLHKRFITNFDECWVPDYEEMLKSLAGELSHPKTFPIPVKYIGPQSRFSLLENFEEKERKYENLGIVSGPEPHRTKLQNKLEKQFRESNKASIILCGLPGNLSKKEDGLIHIYNHLPDEELAKLIKNTPNIYCRSGYSSIMDLHVLGREANFIPTPGQTEQEYLAKWLGY